MFTTSSYLFPGELSVPVDPPVDLGTDDFRLTPSWMFTPDVRSIQKLVYPKWNSFFKAVVVERI